MSLKFAKNSILNFLGAFTPAIVNLVSVPILVNHLGTADYGLLTLVLALVGYFALLDINATQGSVRFIAEYDSLGETKKANEVITFGLVIYAIIGVTGFILIYSFAPLLVKHVFQIPLSNVNTALATLKIAAVAFFFSQIQAYLLSIPQAMQRYGVTASIESFFGAAAPLISMLVAVYTGSIEDVVSARLALSVINVGVLLICVLRLRPDFKPAKTNKSIRKRLLSFSAFSYLNTIAAVTYAQADRMILGSLLGLSEITLFSIPTTLVNRLFGMTYRLGSVIYPAASQLAASSNTDILKHIYLLASRYLTALNSLLILMLIVYGQDLLHLWVGAQFVEQGYPVLVLAAAGLLIDSLTNLPSLINNAVAHPKTTGLFAVARTLLSIVALIIGTLKAGIVGTAMAHLVTSSVATCAFVVYVHGRSVPVSLRDLLVKAYLPVFIVASLTIATALYTRPAYPAPLLDLISHGALTVTMYVLLSICIVMTSEHKKALLGKIRPGKRTAISIKG